MKPHRILLMPDGAAGGDGTPPDDGQRVDNQPPGSQQGVIDDAPPGAPAEDEPADDAAATTGLTKDDITAILQQVMPQGQPAPAQRQEPAQRFTQEDYDRAFNVYKPDATLLANIRSEDPNVAIGALAALRDGFIKQAMTMAETRIQQITGQIRDNEIAPLSEYVSEARAEALRSSFMTTNKDLEGFEPIVDAVSLRLEQSGARFRNTKEMFAEIGKQARAVVKQFTAVKAGNGNGAAAGTPRSNRMSAVSAGGQAGSGSSSRSNPNSNLPKGVQDGLAALD